MRRVMLPVLIAVALAIPSATAMAQDADESDTLPPVHHGAVDQSAIDAVRATDPRLP